MNATTKVRDLGGGLLLATLFAAAPAVAQPDQSDWLGLLGCWQPTEVTGEHLVCVRPESSGAIEMVTWTDGAIASTEVIRADGQERAARREGCNGWESAQFSEDGRRLYIRSDFACEGDVRRASSGLISMTSTSSWMDVQAVDVEGRVAVRVMRYRMATPEAMAAAGVSPIAADRAFAVSTARTAMAAPLTVDDVIDASAHVAPEAVEAWLVERDDRLALDGDRLLRMADAGVPESVIDMAVAVSYPATFAVNQDNLEGERIEEEYQRADHIIYAAYPGYYDSFYYDPFLRYSRYGQYYSPWGYSGGWGWNSGYNPVIVIVDPGDEQAQPRGRVVNGRGYTRGGRTVSSPGESGTYRQPTRTSTTKATSSSGSRAAGVSTGSASSGSSSTKSTGRKAKAKGGTGGTP